MTNVRNRLVALGALLAVSFAPPTAAEPTPEGAAESPESGQGPQPMSPDDPHYAGGYHFAGYDYYEGRSSKAELDARVAEMARIRSKRRNNHATGVRELWGASVLNRPDAREDLRLHARREAYLYRALFLALTDPSVKERKALVDRVQELVDREDARHENVMQSIKAAVESARSAAPSASATPGGK
jgi:hypothetical protein